MAAIRRKDPFVGDNIHGRWHLIASPDTDPQTATRWYAICVGQNGTGRTAIAVYWPDASRWFIRDPERNDIIGPTTRRVAAIINDLVSSASQDRQSPPAHCTPTALNRIGLYGPVIGAACRLGFEPGSPDSPAAGQSAGNVSFSAAGRSLTKTKTKTNPQTKENANHETK